MEYFNQRNGIAEWPNGSYKLTFEDLVLKALNFNQEEFQYVVTDSLDKM